MKPLKPVVWTVAGSDSGAGAGLQADLKTFEAFGVHGCSVVAAITAQNSKSVICIEAVSPDLLNAQLAALAEDMPPSVIKTGMLGSAENLQVLANWVDKLRTQNPKLALVVDPVLGATTGASFADDALLRAYREVLIPRATLITPNRREAMLLLGCEPLTSNQSVEAAARSLMTIKDHLGCKNIVITGGDESSKDSLDYALTTHAHAAFNGWLSLPRIATPNNHGTGCVFASSSAAALALDFVPIEAIVLAKMSTAHALRHGYAVGAGAGPVRPREDFAQRIENLPLLIEGEYLNTSKVTIEFLPLANPDMGLYVIVDSAAWVARVLAAGVQTVQLRIKDSGQSSLREEIRESIAIAKTYQAQLFINDHWQIALEESAYGIHIGQEDLEAIGVDGLQAIAIKGLRLGISTHAYWEVCRAWHIHPSYIACGPIHPTYAKAMPWVAQGNHNLAHWCQLLPIPIVAIAGMDAARATEAMHCGASSVAMISAVTAASDPETVIRKLQAAIALGKTLPRRAAPFLAQSTLNT
jgi:hydroxymethylpyrimidine kinase/phosphomethylpyrimidine kinase/thiamine-phosphate diphosphorylase